MCCVVLFVFVGKVHKPPKFDNFVPRFEWQRRDHVMSWLHGLFTFIGVGIGERQVRAGIDSEENRDSLAIRQVFPFLPLHRLPALDAAEGSHPTTLPFLLLSHFSAS